MNFPAVDFALLSPSLIVCITALLTMLLVPFLGEKRQVVVAHLSWIGLSLALVAVSQQIGKNAATFGGMFLGDDFSQFFNGIFISGFILCEEVTCEKALVLLFIGLLLYGLHKVLKGIFPGYLL